MNKIQIVNWILTRRCNLRCDYCRLVRDYKTKPGIYPNMRYYHEHEMSTESVIYGLEKLKEHNPDCFMIFYGGEPTLREDLYEIVNYCNNENIAYTVISNNIDEKKTEELLSKVDYLQGYTASVDPIIFIEGANSDVARKSLQGLQKLTQLKEKIHDVVAEITVTNDNYQFLYPLVKELTNRGINSDITFIDISKSEYYDFSNIEDEKLLVNKSNELKDILDKIIDEKLNVHMRDTLLSMTYDYLPSEYDCKLDKDFHTMCVDADGCLRLCLRLRAEYLALNFTILNVLDHNAEINKNLKKSLVADKKKYCKLCNHTCYMMGEMISNDKETSDNLIHSNVRNEKGE